jgi:hypothetical protein
MNEPEAMVWIADIVMGKIAEAEALIFMERAVQYNAPVVPLAPAVETGFQPLV